MRDDISEVPRDLADRLDDLPDTLAGREYGDLAGDVSALPDREDLPGCRLCGTRLSVANVFTSGDVAVALRLVCPNAEGHEPGAALTYVYEVATRQLYPERWQAIDTDDTATDGERAELTLTVEEFRRDLQRAAAGDPVEDILADRRE